MSAAVLLVLLAQLPYRVADVNTAAEPPYSSSPSDWVEAGGVTFFIAYSGAAGYELWRTDGTDAGTRLVRDLNPGVSSSSIEELAALDAGFVVMLESKHLYVSDGTAAGTTRVCCHTLQVVRSAVVPNGRVVFSANTGGVSTPRLFVLDGSEEGASQIADITVTEFIGRVGGLMLFFGRHNSGVTSALWATDGTSAGTEQLLLASAPGSFTSVPATVSSGSYLWAVIAGVTTLLKTNGTAAGTQTLGPFSPGSVFSELVPGQNRLFCDATSAATGNEVFSSAGMGGDFVVHEARPGSLGSGITGLTSFNAGVLFGAVASAATNNEPFYVDEATGTVTALGDLNPGTAGCFPKFAPNGSRALLVCTVTGTPRSVWVTDGTDAGTLALTAPEVGGFSDDPVKSGNGWLFAHRPAQNDVSDPWITDGTPAGTRRLAAISARATQMSLPYDFGAPLGLSVPFIADDGRGYELQLLDVLDGGITLQGDLWPGGLGGAYAVLGKLGGRVFIAGETPATGIELFATSGQPGDLGAPVRDLVPGAVGSDPGNDGSNVYRAVVVGDRMYFVANTPAEGFELFETDGTSSGTHIVRDINPFGDGNPWLMTPLADGGLVFTAQEDLFVAPTFFRLLGDGGLVPLSANFPTEAAPLGDKLLIDMDSALGWELWITDGTPAGTVPYADVLPGPQGSEPTRLTAQGGRVFFYALDALDNVGLYSTVDAGVRLIGKLQGSSGWSNPRITPGPTGIFFSFDTRDAGEELWFSNGDDVSMVRDIMPGADSSDPNHLVVAAGKVYFAASDVVHGRELWVTDGTAQGTRMVADVLPGPASSEPEQLFTTLGWLFFRAQDETGDFEPWALPLTESPPSIVAQLSGQTGGDGGWFVSDVTVSFTVTDPTVPILTATGCGTSRVGVDGGFIGSTVVTQDGPDTQLPCTAISSGGTSTVTVSVRRDATAPRVTCPPTEVARATSVSGAAVTFPTPVAVDQIDPAPQVSLSQPSGSTFPLGRTVVTVTATDAAGHTSECAFDVEVRDGVAPTLSCPPMESTATAGAPFDFTATATDDLDPMPTLTFSAMPGTVFPAGRSAVTVTAVDAAGNLGACVFYVTVEGVADGGGGGNVSGSCGCGSAEGLGALVLLCALLRRRKRR